MLNLAADHVLRPPRQAQNRRLTMYISAVVLAIVGGAMLALQPYVLPFAVIGLIVAVIIMSTNPLLMLLIYLLFSIGFVQEWVSFFFLLPPIAERAIAFCLIGSILLQSVRARTLFIRATPIGRALMILFFAFGATLITAYWVRAWYDAMYEMLRHLILFLAVANTATTHRKVRIVTLVYVGLVAAMSLMSLKYYYEGHRIYRMGIWRAVGPGSSLSDPNAHAATILYMMPLLIAIRGWSRRLIFRAAWLVLLLAVTWNIVLTGSRTAAVGFLALLAYYVARSRRRLVGLIAAGLTLLLLVAVIPQQYLGRFESVLDTSGTNSASQSARGRWTGLMDGLAMFSSSPITGIGFGCYAVVHGTRFNQWTAAHSLPGQLLGETGVVGAAAFLYFLRTFWVQARKARGTASRLTDPRHRFIPSLLEAMTISLGLLLLLGLGGHNLSRYNWFLLSGLLAAIHGILGLEAGNHSETPSPTRHPFTPCERLSEHGASAS